MQQQPKIYVGNLPFETTSKDLIEFFSSFGEIIEAMVIPDKTSQNKSKGYGFVTFALLADAQKVIQTSDLVFQGRPITIELAKSEPIKDQNGERPNN